METENVFFFLVKSLLPDPAKSNSAAFILHSKQDFCKPPGQFIQVLQNSTYDSCATVIVGTLKIRGADGTGRLAFYHSFVVH